MNRYLNLTACLLLIGFAFFASSCSKDKCEIVHTYVDYEPVYMSYDEFRASVKSESARKLENPGKIYIKGNYIFINEVNEGIHVVDNSNPSSPQIVSFINVPGNVDVSIKGSVLYADSYIDLVAIDVSNPTSVAVLSRQENVFPQVTEWGTNHTVDPAQGVIKEWKATERTETIETECNGFSGAQPMTQVTTQGENGTLAAGSGNGRNNNSAPGRGGSMARFTCTNNTLYTVDAENLNIFDVSSAASPNKTGQMSVGWNVETVFPYDNHLYIGSQTGMFIYNIDNPQSPIFVSNYEHIVSCDPVVVEGDYAYVTLRTGNECFGNTNALHVVDISDKSNPYLVAEFNMTNPHGLGIDNGNLFLCDGYDGFKVFDASNPLTVGNNLTMHNSGIFAYDVIPYNGNLLMISEEGLYQYDYTGTQVQYLSLLASE